MAKGKKRVVRISSPRKAGQSPKLSPKEQKEVWREWKKRTLKVKEIAAKYKIDVGTLYNYVRKFEKK